MIQSDADIEILDTENVQMLLIPNRTLGILNIATSDGLLPALLNIEETTHRFSGASKEIYRNIFRGHVRS